MILINGHFYYFAYGSNMLSERLRGPTRCNSAEPIGVAVATDFFIAFSKRSKDGSGKATLVSEIGRHAYGVLFRVHKDDLSTLDTVEGPAYRRRDDFSVRLVGSDDVIKATTYLAKEIDAGFKPYDWYLALVVAGARQHNIDGDYASGLSHFPYEVDPEPDRPTRKEAIEALKKAGYSDYRVLLSSG